MIKSNGKKDRIIILHIETSVDKVIRTTKEEVYLRIGDRTKLMVGDDLRHLEYTKGTLHFEDEIAQYASIEDLDKELLSEYRERIGAFRLTDEEILRARRFLIDKNGTQCLTNAAVLLFAKNVQQFYPHCRIRFIRVNGTELKTGASFNVIKDRSFDESLIRLIPKAKEFIADQLREFTRFEHDGKFHTYPEYPEFAWVESITNAVVHRQWGLFGDFILVSMFDDRLEIKSPGKLPDIVTIDNIFTTRFARNPHISRVLTEFELVRELNEGVKRIYEDMGKAGLPKPVIAEGANTVKVILYNGIANRTSSTNEPQNEPQSVLERKSLLLKKIKEQPVMTKQELASFFNVSESTIQRDIINLRKEYHIEWIGPSKGGYWIIKPLNK